MQRRSLTFVVISFLVVALIYDSYPGFEAFAEPRDPNFYSGTCDSDLTTEIICCWSEDDLYNPGEFIVWCQKCDINGENCGPIQRTRSPTGPIAPLGDGVLEQPSTSSPFDPTAPLQGGVLEQQEQTPPPSAGPGASPGILEQLEQGSSPELGFSERQQQQPPPADQGATELPPPATEQTQPATVEEEQSMPVCQEGLEFNEGLGFCVPTECPEGQELNEETGICVLEEQSPAAEEPEEQPTEEPTTEEEQPSEESDSGDESNN